jgi:hypothetical protein
VRAISLLRSAVAEPGRRLNGALLILTVIVGIVVMHSMSGSPTSHSHGPHATSVVSVQDAAEDGHSTADPPGATGVCADGCGGHDVAMAMCLMVLVALLSLVVPPRRLLWRALPAWSVPTPPVAVALRPAAPPSLHELCISRT